VKQRERQSDERLRVLVATHKQSHAFDVSSKGSVELNLAIYKVFPSHSVIACLLLRHYCWIQYTSTLICFRSTDVGLVLIGWDISVVNGREGTDRLLVTQAVHRFVYRQKTVRHWTERISLLSCRTRYNTLLLLLLLLLLFISSRTATTTFIWLRQGRSGSCCIRADEHTGFKICEEFLG